MKIGVLGCFYGCADLLPRVMEPWIALKNEGCPLLLAAVNAQFKEYADLGYPNDDDKTREALKRRQSAFDFLHIAPEPLIEKDARNVVLNVLLEKGVDIVWILDGDEFYTVEQIKGILDYVRRTPQFDYYHIYLDNRIFGTTRWEDDFFPPRIIRTNRHGGIKAFTWDNELVFRDGTRLYDTIPGIIPKRIAHIEHHTWRKVDAAKKIAYQEKHFGYCPFTFDETEQTFAFNPRYYEFHGIPTPQMKEGATIAISTKPAVDVILRTHATGNFRPSITRVTDTLGGKSELTIRTLRSLIHSLLVLERLNDYAIHLMVVDDNSDSETLARMRALLDICPFATEIINLETRGNAASMQYALEYARYHAKGYVYFVEDDYLHEPSALIEMLESYKIFAKNLNSSDIGLFPVDQSDYYLPTLIQSTRVVPGSRRHWRVNNNSTFTFFVPASLLEKQWQLFTKNPESDGTSPGMSEEESLNVVWRQHAFLFTPLPTLAYHIHGAEQMPLFSNWKKLWDSLDEPPYEP